MNNVEDQLSDSDARGSEESDNLANERDLDRFILTGKFDCYELALVKLLAVKAIFCLCKTTFAQFTLIKEIFQQKYCLFILQINLE